MAKVYSGLDDRFSKFINSGKASKKTKQTIIKKLKQQYIDEVLDIFEKHIKKHIETFSKEDITVIDEGNKVKFIFNPEKIKRTSLQTKSGGYTGNGVDNIVALLNNGYEASKQVYGMWNKSNGESVYTMSLKSRTGSLFMQDAMEEFNNKYSKNGAEVKIGDKYK